MPAITPEIGAGRHGYGIALHACSSGSRQLGIDDGTSAPVVNDRPEISRHRGDGLRGAVEAQEPPEGGEVLYIGKPAVESQPSGRIRSAIKSRNIENSHDPPPTDRNDVNVRHGDGSVKQAVDNSDVLTQRSSIVFSLLSMMK